MTFRELIEKHRTNYIKQFLEHGAEKATKGFEVLLSDNEMTNYLEPYNWYRPDYCQTLPGDNITVHFNCASYLNHSLLSVNYRGIAISFYPILWDNIEFEIDKMLVNITDYEDWIRKWIDVKGLSTPNEHGLRNVIHSTESFQKSENGYVTTIDFGSAPFISFFELLDVFHTGGVKNLIIRSEV